MRYAILSAGAGWHVRDLQRAAALLHHEAEAVDFRRIHAGVAIDSATIANPTIGKGYDGVIVRTMPPGSLEQVIFRMNVLHRLQAEGVPVLNPPRPVEVCVDKYLTSSELQAGGVPVPRTIVCQHADAALEAFAALGGDVIVKPVFGSEGRGMVRVSDPDLAWRTFRAIERTQGLLYLQEYIQHPGWDLRAFVLGGRVLTAMRRRCHGGWRTNVAQGGRAEPVDLTADEQRLALRAAEIVGAVVAGVDLLPGPDGRWYVLEVNAVPGWRALAPVTGVDIALEIMKFFANEYRI